MESVNQSSPRKVFICHSWKNKKAAYRIEAELKTAGLDVWVDHSEVRGGDPIPQNVSEAIETCDVFVLIWSRKAKHSKWVEREWTAAFNLDKKIIAFQIDRTKLPGILMGSAHVPAKNIDNGVADLTNVLQGIRTPPEPKKRSPVPLKLVLGMSGVFVLTILIIISAIPDSVFEIEVFAKKCSFGFASDAGDEEAVPLLFSGIWTTSVSYENVQPIELYVNPEGFQPQIQNPITISPDPSSGRITFTSMLPNISIQDIIFSANSRVVLQRTNHDLVVELRDGHVPPYHALSLADTTILSVQNCSVTDGGGRDLGVIFEEPIQLQLRDFSKSLTLYGQNGGIVTTIRVETATDEPSFLHGAQIRDLSFDKSVISSVSGTKESTIDSVSIHRNFPRADFSRYSKQAGDLALSPVPNNFLVTAISIKDDMIAMNMQGRFESLELKHGVSRMEMVPGLFSLITQHPKLAVFLTAMVWLGMFAGFYLVKRLKERC